MTDVAKKLIEEAFLLPREDRAELVDKLLGSLNIPVDEKLENLWAAEAEKRVKEYNDGQIKAIDGEQVFKEIRNRIQSRNSRSIRQHKMNSLVQ